MKSSFTIIILDIFHKSSDNGFTKGLVVVVVEGVVEEPKLGAKAINGGSDTMKSKVMQKRKSKRKTEKDCRKNLMKRKSVIIYYLIQIQAPIYVTITTSAGCGANLTNSNSMLPDLDMCT